MLRIPIVVVFPALLLLLCPPAPAAQQSSRGLVSTWLLAEAQRTDERTSVPGPTPRGMIVFDAAGHVLEIVARAGRPLYTGNQPSPEEALATFTNYGGFWGNYRADENTGRITYRVTGGISPNLTNAELVRSYQLTGNQLTIASGAEPGAQGNLRTTWRRVPNIENLTPTYRQVVGFWQWVSEGSYVVSTGAPATQVKREPSIIVYAPSGYIGVHFIPGGRKRIEGPTPTSEEARASIAGYVSYIAILGLYPGHIVHHTLVPLNPTQLTMPLERDFELRGDEVHLRFTPTTVVQGQERQTRVVLKRLSGATDMLPAS
jgi:hypothetical protein